MVGGNVPKEYWPAIEKGFKISPRTRVCSPASPASNFKVTLVDGGFHAVDSSAVAFEIAAKAAYRQSMPESRPPDCLSQS